jgi:hypothetical protein
MQNEATRTPRSRRLWLIVPAIILGCCVIGTVAVFLAWPSLRGSWQATAVTPTVEATVVSPAATKTGPAAGGLADELLKTDVWNSIRGFYASNRNCTEVSSAGIEVTQKPDSHGIWQEAWTVTACGEVAVLHVKFTPSPQGGTDYHITQ